MMQASPDPDLFRAVASAKRNADLAKLLAPFVKPADLASERVIEEQAKLALAVGRLDHFVKMGVSERQRFPRPAFGRQELANWFAAEADAADRARLLKATTTIINAGLRRSVTFELSPDGKTLEPIACDVFGTLWLQLAAAVRGAIAGRAEVECAHCGSKFVPKRKAGKRAPTKFCSTKCRLDHFYASRRPRNRR